MRLIILLYHSVRPLTTFDTREVERPPEVCCTGFIRIRYEI